MWNLEPIASADEEIPLSLVAVLDKHFVMLPLRVLVTWPGFCRLCWAYCCPWHTSTTQAWSSRSWHRAAGWRRQRGHSSPACSRASRWGTHWPCYRCVCVCVCVYVYVYVYVYVMFAFKDSILPFLVTDVKRCVFWIHYVIAKVVTDMWPL